MTVIFSDIAGADVFILPIEPPDIKTTSESENQTIDTLNGEVRITGGQKLKCWDWSSFFHVNKNYSFAQTGAPIDGSKIAEFLDNMQAWELPIKFIRIDSQGNSINNEHVTVDRFEWNYDNVGDIKYTISLTQFPTNVWQALNGNQNTQKYLKDLVKTAATNKALKTAGLL
jgi:hypothetical protein